MLQILFIPIESEEALYGLSQRDLRETFKWTKE